MLSQTCGSPLVIASRRKSTLSPLTNGPGPMASLMSAATDLNKARALLEQLGAEIPNLPPYDPAKDEKLPWEDEVAAAIEKLRAEKSEEKVRANFDSQSG